MFRQFINKHNFRIAIITNAKELWTEVKDLWEDFTTKNDLINFAIKTLPLLPLLLICNEHHIF